MKFFYSALRQRFSVGVYTLEAGDRFKIRVDGIWRDVIMMHLADEDEWFLFGLIGLAADFEGCEAQL